MLADMLSMFGPDAVRDLIATSLDGVDIPAMVDSLIDQYAPCDEPLGVQFIVPMVVQGVEHVGRPVGGLVFMRDLYRAAFLVTLTRAGVIDGTPGDYYPGNTPVLFAFGKLGGDL